VQPWDKNGFSVPGGAGAAASQMFTLGAARIAADTQRNFPAPLAILSSLYEGTVLPMDAALQIESKYFAKLVTGVVARNLMRTLFVNKGLADKLARRPADVPKSVVRKLGVLGAGMMGGGIAYSAACAGVDVVLLDTSMELADNGRARIADLLAKEQIRGARSATDANAVLQRIHATSQFADLAGCEFIIEAVFEQRDIKEHVIRQAEAVLDERVVFASNTSTLPIAGLAALSLRPNQFIGLHFFSPVEKMPLVEVIVAKQTSNATLARALDLVGQLRKTPIVVNDSRGFYTSRIFGTFVHEGMRMLEEGVGPALIENSARMAGMPVGPLAVSDEVSIELLWKVISQSAHDLGAAYVKPPGYSVVQRFVVTLGRLGRRHGGGFYEYPRGLPKRLWRGLSDIYPPSLQQPGAEEIKKRLLYIQALESARCFEEGVMAHPADADLGSILGWGFPSWTGGTLSLIETVGLKTFVAECDRMAALYGDRFGVSDWLRARAERDQTFYGSPSDPADRSVRVA
jgi:3-hydroxyacyl-CoA dehydrogenase/enoyl-CoA hydratase/3-hydroxybutyryl-CoA epimerase